MTTDSIAERAATARETLRRMDFSPVGINPLWYESVVIAMLIDSGVRTAIDDNAENVARALGWQVQRPNRRGSHPCFHLGMSGVRRYFLGRVAERRVGAVHTFEHIEPYCATHQRSWVDCEFPGDPCVPACKYRLRIR